MRRVLLVLLSFGVFAGYGSAIASARWHHRQQMEGGGCEGRWGRDYRDEARTVVAPAPAPSPQAQVINVPQAAPAAPTQQLPAQQIFLIMPGAQGSAAAPQVITVPVPTPAAVPAPAPAPATP